VPLPAMRIRQVYEITLITREGPEADAIERLEAAIDWPEELVNSGDFIKPSLYAKHRGAVPVWPNRSRALAWMTLAVSTLLLSGLALVRNHIMRITAALLLSIITAVVIGSYLRSLHSVIASHSGEDENLTVLKTRRTEQWQSRQMLIPVYADQSQIVEETMVVYPDRVVLTVRTGETRLLRPPAYETP
jgi:hypothetical protein